MDRPRSEFWTRSLGLLGLLAAAPHGGVALEDVLLHEEVQEQKQVGRVHDGPRVQIGGPNTPM
jgi:hypothetical protein